MKTIPKAKMNPLQRGLWNLARKVAPAPHYVSDIWWHFTGYEKGDEDAFKVLELILSSGYIRAGKSQINLSQRGLIGLTVKDPVTFYEGPRSCVADIPLENMSVHGNRYGPVGFGLSSEELRKDPGIQINSVLYIDYHLQNQLRPKINSTDIPYNLVKPFVKVCDDAESFHEIYLEREWRPGINIPITDEALEYLIVPRNFVHRAESLLKTNFLKRAAVLVWEDEIGDLPKRGFA